MCHFPTGWPLPVPQEEPVVPGLVPGAWAEAVWGKRQLRAAGRIQTCCQPHEDNNSHPAHQAAQWQHRQPSENVRQQEHDGQRTEDIAESRVIVATVFWRPHFTEESGLQLHQHPRGGLSSFLVILAPHQQTTIVRCLWEVCEMAPGARRKREGGDSRRDESQLPLPPVVSLPHVWHGGWPPRCPAIHPCELSSLASHNKCTQCFTLLKIWPYCVKLTDLFRERYKILVFNYVI